MQKRAEYASDTLTKVSPSIQLTQFEDGAIYVHDGHHRCVSTFLAGRGFLRADEYDLRKWTYAQYLEINGPNRWWTPFDPRLHLRHADVKSFKEEAARRFNLDPHACVKWIRENPSAYRVNKAADVPSFTVADLAKVIYNRLGNRLLDVHKISEEERLRRLNRNLIVCTSLTNWQRYVAQVEKLKDRPNHSTPEAVFRWLLAEAITTFEDYMYDANVEILHRHRVSIPMDTYMAEIGPSGDRVYFEYTPYHDRIVFVEKDNNEMLDEILKNPVQVAYPECMAKPLAWLPFVTQIAFDGQQQTDLTKLFRWKP